MNGKRICVVCKEEYKEFVLSNYNLGLCQKCFEKNENKVELNESCDEVTHKIICPKCNRIYEKMIVDEKCKTDDCNVWFFWDSLDCRVIARWLEK